MLWLVRPGPLELVCHLNNPSHCHTLCFNIKVEQDTKERRQGWLMCKTACCDSERCVSATCRFGIPS